MSDHTPTPWEWDHGDDGAEISHEYSDIFVDGGETIIASINFHIPEGDANARFILRAVNNHERLVRVLKELQKWEAHYRETHDLHGGSAMETGRAWVLMRRAGDKARAAIAEAEKNGRPR